METLISLAYRDLWDALTEINHLFRDMCSNKLKTQHMETLKTNII